MPFQIDFNLSFAVDMSLAVFLWLVQCILYPSLRYLRSDVFMNWHTTYQRRVSMIIGPILLLQMALVSFEALYQPSVPTMIRLSLLSICWLVTAVVSVPLHRKIERGEAREQSIERLIQTNWIRTVAWTSLFVTHLL